MAGSAEFVVQSKFRCRSAFAGVAEVQQRCGCRGLAAEVIVQAEVVHHIPDEEVVDKNN